MHTSGDMAETCTKFFSMKRRLHQYKSDLALNESTRVI